MVRDLPSAVEVDDILDLFDDTEAQRGAQPQGSKQRQTSDIDRSKTDVELRRRRDHVNSQYQHLGSDVKPNSSPRTQLHSPPDIQNVSIETLVASQAHLGHSTALWNPITQPYIYGSRNGIHIFNLDITLSHLRRAAAVVKGVAQNDGNILFVGTRAGQKRSVVEASKRAGGFHVFERWIPGTITNGKQVVGNGKVKHLLTKHQENKQPTENSTSHPNSIIPDLVVILNPLENRNLLKECAKGRVPTIGIIDSDADPRWVTYSIPANDDSLRCSSLIVGILSRAAAAGRAEMSMPGWEQIEV